MAKKKGTSKSEPVARNVRQAIGEPAEDRVYQLKIQLDGAHLPIWRVIQTADVTLDDLHFQIQAAMGWDDDHLHQFRVGKVKYMPPSPDGFDLGFGPLIKDSERVRLSTVLNGQIKGFKFKYEYDFGDSWMHTITFNGLVPREPGAKYPRCIDGKNACPPEDIGGIWGYSERLEILEDPEHPEYDEISDWMGDFDPHAFSVAEADEAMPRRRSR